jgi:hypothetical protein
VAVFALSFPEANCFSIYQLGDFLPLAGWVHFYGAAWGLEAKIGVSFDVSVQQRHF